MSTEPFSTEEMVRTHTRINPEEMGSKQEMGQEIRKQIVVEKS